MSQYKPQSEPERLIGWRQLTPGTVWTEPHRPNNTFTVIACDGNYVTVRYWGNQSDTRHTCAQVVAVGMIRLSRDDEKAAATPETLTPSFTPSYWADFALYAEHQMLTWRNRANIAEWQLSLAERERNEARAIVDDVREWWKREGEGPQYNGHTRESDEGKRIWWEWWRGNIELADKVRVALNIDGNGSPINPVSPRAE